MRLLSFITTFALIGCAAPENRAQPDGLISVAYEPPAGRQPLEVGQLMVECERHLRTWQLAMSAPRTQENRDSIAFLERAIATLVHREQSSLEVQAVSGPPRNRGIACAALGFSGDPAVVPLLANNVTSEDEFVAENALLGLGRMGDPSTPLTPLYEVVMNTATSPAVMRNAAYASMSLASTLQVDPDGVLSSILIPIMDHQDERTRAQAIIGLGFIRCAHVLPKLNLRLLEDESIQVRKAAAWALGEIGARSSSAVLMRALEDDDPIVGGTARGSLTKIHGNDFGPKPDNWVSVIEL
ncbi:MAG: HEAT repeat domain-containing protein [Planctomycetes bacterium]|nr:HEAT repeat domain-containing protein [Planctomycetota bacterium]